MVKCYNSTTKQIIQYGGLVNGCTCFSNVNSIFLVQKNIIKMIFLKENMTASRSIRSETIFFSVASFMLIIFRSFVCGQ